MEHGHLLAPLLWLPDTITAVSLETTDLITEDQVPDILSLGVAVASEGNVIDRWTGFAASRKAINPKAKNIHGINEEAATGFPPLSEAWCQLFEYLNDEHVVIHGASFAWTILLNAAAEHGLEMPKPKSVFCTLKALTLYGQFAMGATSNGPSLTQLTNHFISDVTHTQVDDRAEAGRDAEKLAQALINLKHMLTVI